LLKDPRGPKPRGFFRSRGRGTLGCRQVQTSAAAPPRRSPRSVRSVRSMNAGWFLVPLGRLAAQPSVPAADNTDKPP